MSRIKDEIEVIVKELGQYATEEEARGTIYVSAKVSDVKDYLKGLWSKPVALGVAVIALALGCLVGWSCNESRHAAQVRPADAVEVAK